MNSRRALVIGTLVLALLAAGFWQGQRLKHEAKIREAYLITIHTRLTDELRHTPRPLPADASLVLAKAMGSGMSRTFMMPFPDGLTLDSHGDHGFTLAEPEPRRVSLFRKDRLISTDTDPPRWERSGKPAVK